MPLAAGRVGERHGDEQPRLIWMDDGRVKFFYKDYRDAEKRTDWGDFLKKKKKFLQ